MTELRRLTEELVRLATREVADAGLMPGFDHFSEVDYDEHLDAFLRDRPEGPLHVFAYGSLIWKPVFAPEAVRRGVAHGWHRAFTLRIERFRGTPKHPGLMMGLVPGGRCAGLLLQLPGADPRGALIELLRREMPFRQFATMVRRVGTTSEAGLVPALVFWAGSLPLLTRTGLSPEETAGILARACGHGGSCADYLYQTIVHLEEHGIRDRNLWRLQALVAAEIARWDA
jgi:glutathione-specific gamma-glutamylcyclotransferase